jgi:hypothetical protein
VQAEIPNHRKLRRLRTAVVSVAPKALPRAGQVFDEKTNVCEPLLTHRNVVMASKPGMYTVPGAPRAVRRSGSQAAACVLAWWCPVYRWRELVVGAVGDQRTSNHIFAIDDLALRTAVLQTYNDFNVDVQTESNGRLLPQALLPIWNTDLCVKEVITNRQVRWLHEMIIHRHVLHVILQRHTTS